MPRRYGLSVAPMLALLACVLAGCDSSGPPQFQPDRLTAVEYEIVPPHQEDIAVALADLYGTPDEPTLPESSELDPELIAAAAGPVRSNKPGEALGLYRQHCAHCHGITGDGMGPTAALLDPYPRDFRTSKFKFKSTYLKYPPTDDDLRRTLVHGIPGTAMPSFKLLGDEQIDALVEYVKYLSQRGQVENELNLLVADELDFDPDTGTTDDRFDPAEDEDDLELLEEALEMVEENWLDAENNVVEPNEELLPPEGRNAAQLASSIAAGRDLFFGEKANCVKCHGNTGLGDGPQIDFDDWNKRVKEFASDLEIAQAKLEEKRTKLAVDKIGNASELAELKEDSARLDQRQTVLDRLLSPRQADARNLRGGVLRGGRRPRDIYLRIHQGIAGSPMPAFGAPRPGRDGTLSDVEIWQLVDYIMALTSGQEIPEQTSVGLSGNSIESIAGLDRVTNAAEGNK